MLKDAKILILKRHHTIAQPQADNRGGGPDEGGAEDYMSYVNIVSMDELGILAC